MGLVYPFEFCFVNDGNFLESITVGNQLSLWRLCVVYCPSVQQAANVRFRSIAVILVFTSRAAMTYFATSWYR
jgi:hypothetical protein